MTQRSKIFFVSDSHLGLVHKEPDHREQALLDFLEWGSDQASHLFVLGDLFEFWFEYKGLIPKTNLRLLSRFQEIGPKGVELHYVAGNHDFALGSFLSEEIGMTLHWNPFTMILQGKKIFIAHGDGLNKRDIGYRLLKPILRNRANQWLYRQLPADAAIAFAKWCVSLSRSVVVDEQKKQRVREAYRRIALAQFQQGHSLVVMGHTHMADEWKNGPNVYVNASDWKPPYPYGLLENGELSLQYFKEKKHGN